jgi:hypothetical protein
MTSAPRSHAATGGHTWDPPARRSFAWSLPSRRSSMRRSPSARVRASSGPSSGHAERCSQLLRRGRPCQAVGRAVDPTRQSHPRRQARRPDRSRQSGGSASRGNPAVGILQGLDAVTRHDISPLGSDHGKPRSATFQFGHSGVVRHPGQRAAVVSAQPGAASTYAAVTASEVGWLTESLDCEAQRLGVTRQPPIKIWIAERLELRADQAATRRPAGTGALRLKPSRCELRTVSGVVVRCS